MFTASKWWHSLEALCQLVHVLRSACLFPETAVRLGSEPVKMLALGAHLNEGLLSMACLYFCVSVFVTWVDSQVGSFLDFIVFPFLFVCVWHCSFLFLCFSTLSFVAVVKSSCQLFCICVCVLHCICSFPGALLRWLIQKRWKVLAYVASFSWPPVNCLFIFFVCGNVTLCVLVGMQD